MDIFFKVLITFLSITILLTSGLALTLSIADEIETHHYFTSVANTVLNSHYNEEVAELLIEEAEEKGYHLTIQISGSRDPGCFQYATLTLSYEYHLPLFQIHIPRTKQKII